MRDIPGYAQILDAYEAETDGDGADGAGSSGADDDGPDGEGAAS
jgi:hypothetical protein